MVERFGLTRCASIVVLFVLVLAFVARLDKVCIDQNNISDGRRVSFNFAWLGRAASRPVRRTPRASPSHSPLLDVEGQHLSVGASTRGCRRRLTALLLTIGRVSNKDESAAVRQIDTEEFGKSRDKAETKDKSVTCCKDSGETDR